MNPLKSTVGSAFFVGCCLENRCAASRYLGDLKDRVTRDILHINTWSAEAKKCTCRNAKNFETPTFEFKSLQEGMWDCRFSPLTWIHRYINYTALSEPPH